MEEENRTKFSNFEKFHDKNYKLLLLIPMAFIIFSLVYIGYFHSVNKDFIHKDISLTGGTSVTIYGKIDPKILERDLSEKLEEINTRKISDLMTREQKAVILETKTEGGEVKKIIEEYLGYELNDENSSFEFTGSTLSESFYKQLLIAVLFAFLLMAITVFLIFRKFIPSIAVISSAFADILMALVFVNLLGMRLSSAGIIAFLMLIGYSVDTDILLMNRILKEYSGSVNKRLFEAFKTGITMTLTSLSAVLVALILVASFSRVLSQIFIILAVGLSFDILNTWVTNVSLIKWYVKKHEN